MQSRRPLVLILLGGMLAACTASQAYPSLALRDVEALSGLRHARSVTISGNPRLENLRGLGSIRKVDRLLITKNGIFCTTGLEGLAEAREVVISQNPRLLSLRGLESLASAEGDE